MTSEAEQCLEVMVVANAELKQQNAALVAALEAVYNDGLVVDALSLAGLEDVLDTMRSALAQVKEE